MYIEVYSYIYILDISGCTKIIIILNFRNPNYSIFNFATIASWVRGGGVDPDNKTIDETVVKIC